eukprot:XP_011605114.1 PREDICTED: uncharacterized protein LOC105416869 [Takifugu rubripes]
METPLRIIEYIWAHRMEDVLEDVDPSEWPDMDSQPLSLEDAGRLRVVSAKVHSIVKNRDKEHFERVVNFLEDTYRLLPTLVAPIKHMKIVFGLKTMIIMWMLKQERGMIDIMFKINQFFPSRLPQYQNQCSQREMFLMKKNHLDFKDLAQSLAMDKVKLERYVTNQMQEQYGEHYAQKVEDRLLQYLQKLETVLPGDAYIDKILKKESPVSEEEKLLLDVVASDPATIATTLKKLLQCEVTFLDLGKELSEHRRKGPQLSRPPLRTSLKAKNSKDDVQFQGREEAAVPGVPVDGPLLLENEKDSASRPPHQTKGDGRRAERVEEVRANSEELVQGSSEDRREAHRLPQFCSKHQRWVKSILQECPEERSDNELRRANVWPSPPLFPSSSSSSQDLTSSDLIPYPAGQQHPISDTSGQLQTPEETCEKASSKDQMTSGSSSCDSAQSRLLLRPASCRDTRVSPSVRLVDLASGSSELYFKLHNSFPSHSATATHHQEASVPSNRARRSPPHQSPGSSGLLQGATSNSLKNKHDAGSDPGNGSSSPSATAANTHLPRRPSGSDEHLTRDASTSPCQPATVPAHSGGNRIPPSIKSCQRNVPVDSTRVFPHAPASYPPPQPSTPKDARDGALAGRFLRAPLRLSLPSQAVLLRSKLLQPRVSVGRLSSQHCYQATGGRSSSGYEQRVAHSSRDGEDRGTEEEENGDSSFDLNLLYSSLSSSSGGEDSTLLDPDYKPCIKKKRLLLEYEAARNLL